MADGASPAAQGFRMPAEWEPHHATWIGWPHNASDWPGKIATIPWVYGEIVRKLAPGEIVRILVNSAAHERRARRVLARAGVDDSRAEVFRFPTNRGRTRDFVSTHGRSTPTGRRTTRCQSERRSGSACACFARGRASATWCWRGGASM